jgi:hypothetical protein
MTHFEAYRWEDHVPRAGSWKFNLAIGVLALGLIAAAFPDTYSSAPAIASAAAAPGDVVQTSAKAIVQPVRGWSAYCPTDTTDYVDS